jgi:hypothetical protein
MRAGVRFLVIATPPGWRIDDRQAPLKTPSVERLPIDSVLLRTLVEANVGGFAKDWKRAAKIRWSKFGSADYEQVIALIRQASKGSPLWKIEEHWSGNQ